MQRLQCDQDVKRPLHYSLLTSKSQIISDADPHKLDSVNTQTIVLIPGLVKSS